MVDALHTIYGNRLGISSSAALLLDGDPVKMVAEADTLSTAAATLSAQGISTIGTTAAAAATWTLPAPTVGAEKWIRLAYASTAGTHQVAATTGSQFGQASSNTHIGFTTVDQSVYLVGESTTKWGIYGQGTSVPVVLS